MTAHERCYFEPNMFWTPKDSFEHSEVDNRFEKMLLALSQLQVFLFPANLSGAEWRHINTPWLSRQLKMAASGMITSTSEDESPTSGKA